MSLCDPCGRSFVETAQLLVFLREDQELSPRVRAQMDVVAAELRSTGQYLTTKEIMGYGYGRPQYKEE